MKTQTPINPDNSKFKDNLGRYLTLSLFYETSLGSISHRDDVMYTLKEHSYEGFPSLRELYLDMEDITEYNFANEYLGGWNHWKKLCKTAWFMEHLTEWREELELKLRARAFNEVKKTAKSSAKEAYMANKYLLEKGWEKDTNKKETVGRPTQEKIKKEAQRLHDEEKVVEDDAARILN